MWVDVFVVSLLLTCISRETKSSNGYKNCKSCSFLFKPLLSLLAMVSSLILSWSFLFIKENYPRKLIINWDHTGSKFVLASRWTMAYTSNMQVAIVGLEDNKKKMTV